MDKSILSADHPNLFMYHFTILCFLLALTNIQTIVILNTFVLTKVVVFGLFVAFANIQYKDHTLLKPILEHGFKPVISGTIYPLSGLIELIVLLFIQQKVHGKMTTKLFLINSVILAGLLLGPLIGSLTEFGPYEAARQKYPAFEQWGLVSLGRFIEHLDFLSIYQWITGAFIRISFFLFLSAEAFTFKSNKKKITLLAGSSVFLIISNLISHERYHLLFIYPGISNAFYVLVFPCHLHYSGHNCRHS